MAIDPIPYFDSLWQWSKHIVDDSCHYIDRVVVLQKTIMRKE